MGSIEENLASLQALAEPPMECALTRKVWALCHEPGVLRAKLVEGVVLLQHLGWSSTTVEQQHASATLVKRQHHKYGLSMLCTRAMLHTSRLFYAVDPLDSQEKKLQLKLEAQLEKRWSGFQARPCFSKR